jgi:hypothetical protein
MPLKIQSSPAAQRHQRLLSGWNHAACGGSPGRYIRHASVKHPPTRKRVPDAELILRGTCGEQTCGQQIKAIEFRSRPTKRIGERFYIYASQQWAEGKLLLEGCRLKVQSDECRVQGID